ncbi:MAG: hypothetical protein HY287_15715 [Planctomycetes bacterium]|nr:hypothetical protein [Planctomycetota bacterium]MBI3835773.1 hypothetical protein [Planctomycetota bacterium]
MFTLNRNPSQTDLRSFGRAMVIGFGALAMIAWLLAWRKSGGAFLDWHGSRGQIIAIVFLSLGTLLFSVSRISLPLTRTIYLTWMSVANPIGLVMSIVMLTILFAIILPIFSLIIRAADPLRKRLGAATYWEDYPNHDPTLERLRRPF